MCGRFVLIPRNIVEDIAQEINAGRHVNVMPDWPAVRQSAYPGSTVSLLVPDGSELAAEDMVWGYKVHWKSGAVFNTRLDTALAPKRNMWSESIAERRCVVPTLGFFEPHQTERAVSPKTGKEIKQQWLFESMDDTPLFIAAIHERGRFSIVTVEPNEDVAPVHPRMPLTLAQPDISEWLWGDYGRLEGVRVKGTRR